MGAEVSDLRVTNECCRGCSACYRARDNVKELVPLRSFNRLPPVPVSLPNPPEFAPSYPALETGKPPESHSLRALAVEAVNSQHERHAKVLNAESEAVQIQFPEDESKNHETRPQNFPLVESGANTSMFGDKVFHADVRPKQQVAQPPSEAKDRHEAPPGPGSILESGHGLASEENTYPAFSFHGSAVHDDNASAGTESPRIKSAGTLASNVSSALNKDLLDLFPDKGGPMSYTQALVFWVGLGFIWASILILFSAFTGISYKVYRICVRIAPLRYPFLGAGISLALMLHATNWYSWSLQMKVVPTVVTVYLILIGGACYAKSYPAAPLIVVHMQFPIFLAAFRFLTRFRISARNFFVAAGLCTSFFASLSIALWIAWIFIADMPWGTRTKAEMRSHMSDVMKEYGERDWNKCLEERQLSSGANGRVLNRCSKIELTIFLSWISPVIECMVLCVLSLFCFCRVLFMRRKYTVHETSLKVLVFFFAMFGTGFWLWCAIAGASMQVSQVVFAYLGISALIFCIWLLFAVNLEHMLAKAKGTIIYQLAAPLLRGDCFIALMFCFTAFCIFVFVILEFVVRQCERLVGVLGSGSPYITKRGRMVLDYIVAKHWASVLEKAYLWCALYLTFFLCSRFTPVFLSWLKIQLAAMSFTAVCIIFYIVGIIMFLLPPVPGVPVYIAAGTIIVARGKQEPWLSFWTGILFASALSLVLKLSAVTVQQKVFGEGFGRSLHVQQLVGVHTTGIRAIEKILGKPGLTVEKVAILCGGPDWPTSVLTGILKLSLPQMLLGTLPCFFLIVPCVLAGASFTETHLKSISPVMIMLAGISQGATLLLATVFVAKETERSHAELSKPRPEHEALIKKSEMQAQLAAEYRKSTAWISLSIWQKSSLMLASQLQLTICWGCFFLGPWCFRSFKMGGDIGDSFTNGGLEGNVWNMVKDPGYYAFGAMGCAWLFFIMYKCTTMRSK